MDVSCFTAFSGLSILLVLLPSRWHWRSRNTGTLIYIGWSFAANVTYFVNAVVWHDNVNNFAPIWCDIAIKLQTGFGPGLSGANLCITRRLAKVATSQTVLSDRRQRRNDILVDVSIGVGIPIMVMITSVVVQAHRFDIVEGLGCSLPIWASLPAIFIIPLWPIVFGVASSVYGIIAIKAFLSKRLHFNNFLQGSRSGLTTSHYIRLMALALSDLLLTLPLSIYFLHGCVKALAPWTSWDDIHSDFGQIRLNSVLLFDDPEWMVTTFLPRWLAPLSSLLFFMYFGLTQDACEEYRSWYLVLYNSILPRRSGPKEQSFLPSLGTKVAQPGRAAGRAQDQEITMTTAEARPTREPCKSSLEAVYLQPIAERRRVVQQSISVLVDHEIV